MTGDLLDRIDAATAPVCAQCDRPLGDSPSDDFCSPDCQQTWTAHQHDVRELTGYIDPWHRPHEFPGAGTDSARWRNGEAVTEHEWVAPSSGRWLVDIDLSGFRTALQEASRVYDELARAWSRAFEQTMLGVRMGPVHYFTVNELGPTRHLGAVSTPAPAPPQAPERLDLSWLDYYVPALDDPIDHEAAAKRLFPGQPLRIPHGALVETAGPAVHADPRRNQRRSER